MSITIELPDDLAERLRALAAEAGQDINEFAVATLREAAEEEPDPELDVRFAEARERMRAHKTGKSDDV